MRELSPGDLCHFHSQPSFPLSKGGLRGLYLLIRGANHG